MTLSPHVQRLLDAFNQAAHKGTRFGIAAVLTALSNREIRNKSYSSISAEMLDVIVKELTAPSDLERALSGDPKAARQFLLEAGIITPDGQLAPQYREES